tara:strand:+ start:3506 stop:3694 length:189 start_codon:yes stop_codon:yes gene_type:complete
MNKIFYLLKQLQNNIICKSVYLNKQEYDYLKKIIKKKKINYIVDVHKQSDNLFFLHFEKFKN